MSNLSDIMCALLVARRFLKEHRTFALEGNTTGKRRVMEAKTSKVKRWYDCYSQAKGPYMNEVSESRETGDGHYVSAEEYEKLLAATEWSPIEEAPKDGSWIWGIENGEDYGMTRKVHKEVRWIVNDNYDARGFWADANNQVCFPNHYMPLPQPPKEVKE